MHRKLIHSVRAFGIALSLLTAGLILAVPSPGERAAAASAVPMTVEAQASPEPMPPTRHRRTQARETMALPFFSFAQGLRRGNRS